MASWIFGTDAKDTLLGTAASEIIQAKADDDLILGSGGNDILNGGDGVDTVSYERSSGAVTVTLGSNGGSGSTTKPSPTAAFGGPPTQTDTLSSIENVTGSAYADAIYGNEQDNVLAGLAGADTINGGGGIDTADYQASKAAVVVDLRSTTQHGGDAEGDRLSSIENVTGSAQADSITGNDKANILRGGRGNDTLAGYEGADTLDGGDGVDTADYSFTPARGDFTGVVVNLTTGQASGAGGLADGDTLLSIENVIGTGKGDALTGNERENVLYGGRMDDMLAGLGGADTLVGGDGLRDFADYAASPEGVVVDLVTNENRYGHAHGDKLLEIEAVRGSAFGDEIRGDGNWNTLLGEDGDDLLVAGGNRDTLSGGKGEDRLVGGEGADEMVGGPVAILGTDIIDIGVTLAAYDGKKDVFVYNSVADSKAETGQFDVIYAFEKGIDKIDLSAIDANTTQNGDQSFKVVASLTGHAGELVVGGVPGQPNYAQLYADVDGDAVPDLGIVFSLATAVPTAEDLIL
jgi:Ca2+-binding RTX toxin-like protein